jgi:hypothetical protein
MVGCRRGRVYAEQEVRVSQSGGPRLRLEFWRGFKESMAGSAVTCGRASSETWMHHDARLNCGRLFSMIRTRDGEIGSQFAVDDLTASTVYALLADHRPEIDALFERPLAWRVVSERMHEVEVRRTADLERRDDWPELFAWLAGNLDGLSRALGPFVGRSIPVEHQGDWDEASFFAALDEHNPDAAAPARQILAWSRTSLPHLYWGHGKQIGSFMPSVLRTGIEHSVVSVWTDGLFCLRFQALAKTPAFAADERRAELLERLNAVPRFALPAGVLGKYPGLPLRLLDEPASMRSFLSALDWWAEVVKRG